MNGAVGGNPSASCAAVGSLGSLLDGGRSRSRYEHTEKQRTDRPVPRFALCVKNDGYEASLDVKKVYAVLADERGEWEGFLKSHRRVGRRRPLPGDYFVAIDVPAAAVKVFSTAM